MAKKLETQIQERARRTHIQQRLMLALHRATVGGGMMFAPDAVLLKRIDPEYARKRNPNYRIQQALRRLESKGLVRYEQGINGKSAALTLQGKRCVERMEAAEKVRIRKPYRWDGRWRIVIFDVWERRRVVRDRLRKLLKKAGLVRLQNSVWVHPYDCEELVTLLRTELRLGGGVLYIVAEAIEHDLKLRRHFDLP